jgi:uncharacterized protein YebE (UPF0316 family)
MLAHKSHCGGYSNCFYNFYSYNSKININRKVKMRMIANLSLRRWAPMVVTAAAMRASYVNSLGSDKEIKGGDAGAKGGDDFNRPKAIALAEWIGLDLNLAGSETDEEVIAIITEKLGKVRLASARESFNTFGADVTCSADVFDNLRHIENALEYAGVDYSALDPSGQKTNDEMKAELDKKSTSALIACARKQYGDLLSSDHYAFECAEISNDILQTLKAAGVSYAALDPSGQKTNNMIEKDIKRRIATAYIRNELLNGEFEDNIKQSLKDDGIVVDYKVIRGCIKELLANGKGERQLR